MSEPHFRVVGQTDRGGEKRRRVKKVKPCRVIARAGGGNRTNINLRVAGSDHNKCQQHQNGRRVLTAKPIKDVWSE